MSAPRRSFGHRLTATRSLLANQTRGDVVGTAGCNRDDDTHRPRRIARATRDTAGSAAAPAARCRNCLRWGSFILNRPLGSHHSITSSARASSVGGTWRPSALAVLRLIASSYLVG